MNTLYIRNVDTRTHAALKKEAKRRDISFSELVRRILDQYAARCEVENLDNKYQAFVTDILKLYELDREDLRESIRKNEILYEQILQVLEHQED